MGVGPTADLPDFRRTINIALLWTLNVLLGNEHSNGLTSYENNTTTNIILLFILYPLQQHTNNMHSYIKFGYCWRFIGKLQEPLMLENLVVKSYPKIGVITKLCLYAFATYQALVDVKKSYKIEKCQSHIN